MRGGEEQEVRGGAGGEGRKEEWRRERGDLLKMKRERGGERGEGEEERQEEQSRWG